jgi:hypothetical protein
MQLEHPTVVSCVGDKQDHPTHPRIAQLQRAPSIKRLDVSQSRLGLDRHILRIEAKDGVPSPSITW